MSEETLKTMSAEEFQRLGYLRELNRQFLHPLGLALSVIREDDGSVSGLGVIWDCRDDPEGLGFGPATAEQREQALRIECERLAKAEKRTELFGSVIQPCL